MRLVLVILLLVSVCCGSVEGQTNSTGDGKDLFPEDIVSETHPYFMKQQSRTRRVAVSYSHGVLNGFGEVASSSIGFYVTKRLQILFAYSPGGTFIDRESQVFYGQNATRTTTVRMPTVYLGADFVCYRLGILDLSVRAGLYRTSYRFRSGSNPAEINHNVLQLVPSRKDGRHQRPFVGISTGASITDRVSLRIFVASQRHKFKLPEQTWARRPVETPVYPKGGLLVQGSVQFLAF